MAGRLAFVLMGVWLSVVSGVEAAQSTQLAVLTTTGETRDGLPVVAPLPDPGPHLDVLTRGFSGRLLHLWALEQEFLRRQTGTAPEPAYLVLSDRRGGFPQVGFYLGDIRKPDVGWVDLHRDSTLSGRLGALDQIFPHELMHVMVSQLAGPHRRSGGNQIHAVGVRTDPVTAFQEGFADHVQILAVDDPDAVPTTHRLPGDKAAVTRADEARHRYMRDLRGRWWPLERERLLFLMWYTKSEQVARYHGIKANVFAHAPVVPERLLTSADPYRAYLWNSVIPGEPDDPIRPVGALHVSKASTTTELLRAWATLVPSDAADLDRVARAALGDQPLPTAPEIWLANGALRTGTSLFDQYQQQPRLHTFDINAATQFDWHTVPGVSAPLAQRLLAGVPYASLDDLINSPDVPTAVRTDIAAMAVAMSTLEKGTGDEAESLGLWSIAWAYLWRLGAFLIVATIPGAWILTRVGVRRPWVAGLIAFAALFMVTALTWIVTSPVWLPFLAPVVAGGVPWAAWRLVRRQPGRSPALALMVWGLASASAVVLTYPCCHPSSGGGVKPEDAERQLRNHHDRHGAQGRRTHHQESHENHEAETSHHDHPYAEPHQQVGKGHGA
jgi:DNA uptake protein ComE-like DNA-binding protein